MSASEKGSKVLSERRKTQLMMICLYVCSVPGLPSHRYTWCRLAGLGRCVLFRVTEHMRLLLLGARGKRSPTTHCPLTSSPHQYRSPPCIPSLLQPLWHHEKSGDSSLPSHFIREKIEDGRWGTIGFLGLPREKATLGNRPPPCWWMGVLSSSLWTCLFLYSR